MINARSCQGGWQRNRIRKRIKNTQMTQVVTVIVFRTENTSIVAHRGRRATLRILLQPLRVWTHQILRSGE